MKHIFFLAVLLTFSFAYQANAQFLRNLKNLATEKSKEVVQFKTTEKAMEKTAEGMDKVLNPDLSGLVNKEESFEQYDNLKSFYSFSYHYRMKSATAARTVFTDYLLHPESSYYGFSEGGETDRLTIFDSEHYFTFSGSGKNKSVKSSKPETHRRKDNETYNFRSSVTVSELPPRNLLGAECPGFQLRAQGRTVDYHILPGTLVVLPPALLETLNPDLPKTVLEHMSSENRGLIVWAEMKDDKNELLFMLECSELNSIGFEFDTAGYTIR